MPIQQTVQPRMKVTPAGKEKVESDKAVNNNEEVVPTKRGSTHKIVKEQLNEYGKNKFSDKKYELEVLLIKTESLINICSLLSKQLDTLLLAIHSLTTDHSTTVPPLRDTTPPHNSQNPTL